METTNILQRVIYGYPDDNTTPILLGLSDGLAAEGSVLWRGFATLDPLPDEQTVGIFSGLDGAYILARAAFGIDQKPVYEYVAMTRADLLAMSGNIRWLVDSVNEPIPQPENQQVPPLLLPAMPTLTLDKRLMALNLLLSQQNCELRFLLSLLGAALDSRRLMIRHFPGGVDARINLIQALAMLLPSPARPDLTFSTYFHDPRTARSRVIFSDSPETGGRYVVDYQTGEMPELQRTPYLDCLEMLWNDDLKMFVSELRTMELMAVKLMAGKRLDEGLTLVAERYMQDRRVLNGEAIAVENIKDVLNNDAPPPGDLREAYLLRLLDYALNKRDTEAAVIVTRWMDDDPSIDELLNTQLIEALKTQPDAVYFLIRTRLSQGVEERWLPRLHDAAMFSLQVAIQSSDTTTLTNWLRLIAREPASYQLSGVLHQGILAAQERAHEDGELGFQLLLFALKRAHNSVEMLLNDTKLLNALPDHLCKALCHLEPAAIASMATLGREVFLLALGRAAYVRSVDVFTPDSLTVFWAVYMENQPSAVPEKYQPVAILHEFMTDNWLSDAGLATLLTLMLSDKRDDLFREMVAKVAARDLHLLAAALDSSERRADDILTLINQAALSQQQVVDLYIELLVKRNWARTALPLVEQVARLCYQNMGLILPPDTLWQMLQFAHEVRTELVAKVVTKRLLHDLEKTENEKVIASDLTRILEQTHWSSLIRQVVLNWWRELVRQQPIPRLQAIDRLIEDKRQLDELHDIIETSVALRKVIGKRSLEDFADAVSTTFGFLKIISEAFDPAPKQPGLNFDPATVRAELDSRANELTPDEQRVLAKNLKELGNLIATMAENRSRASLMRREEEVDRQLTTGELMPHSAIDTLKWLSGYLDGIQDADEETP